MAFLTRTTPTETFRLPKVLRHFWKDKKMAEKKITEASVLALVGRHAITASRGAELLKMSLWDFYDLMHAHGISMDDETPEEMEEDLKTLRVLREKQEVKYDTAI